MSFVTILLIGLLSVGLISAATIGVMLWFAPAMLHDSMETIAGGAREEADRKAKKERDQHMKSQLEKAQQRKPPEPPDEPFRKYTNSFLTAGYWFCSHRIDVKGASNGTIRGVTTRAKNASIGTSSEGKMDNQDVKFQVYANRQRLVTRGWLLPELEKMSNPVQFVAHAEIAILYMGQFFGLLDVAARTTKSSGKPLGPIDPDKPFKVTDFKWLRVEPHQSGIAEVVQYTVIAPGLSTSLDVTLWLDYTDNRIRKRIVKGTIGKGNFEVEEQYENVIKRPATGQGSMVNFPPSLFPSTIEKDRREGYLLAESLGGRLEYTGYEFTHVHFNDTKVTDEHLLLIAKQNRLSFVHLDRTSVTDAGMATLAKLHNLERVSVMGTKVTEAGARLLSKKHPQCYITWSIDALVNARLFMDDNLLDAIEMCGGQVSKEGSMVVSVNLGLRQGQIRDDALVFFKELPALKELHLNGLTLPLRHITDDGLETLGVRPALEVLGLPNTKVTNKGMSRLPELFPNLRELIVGSSTVTDEAIESLARQKKLKSLTLHKTSITPAGVTKLQQLLPGVSITKE